MCVWGGGSLPLTIVNKCAYLLTTFVLFLNKENIYNISLNKNVKMLF